MGARFDTCHDTCLQLATAFWPPRYRQRGMPRCYRYAGDVIASLPRRGKFRGGPQNRAIA